mmetsp:Transcript_76019/g.246712  ORF Transcript_76019/g.246712 Transcript_76019/m.246712 type:complete len:361 (+) Transcript_76019:3717-4799(+)
MRVVLLLFDQLYGALGVVLVKRWHVEVVDEIDHLQFARRSIEFSGLFLQRNLHHGLQKSRVRVVAHVHLVVCEDSRVKLFQQTEARLCLATTGKADEHHGVRDAHERPHDETHGCGLGGRHRDLAHGCGADIFNGLYGAAPLFQPRILDEVIEDTAPGGVLDGLHLVLPPIVELLAIVHAVDLGEATAHGEDDAKHKPILDGLDLAFGEQCVEQTAESAHEGNVHQRHLELGRLADPSQGVRAILVDQALQGLLGTGPQRQLLQPRADVGAPLDPILIGHAHDARPGGCRRRRIVQVANFEDHLHMQFQGDAFVGGQGQQAAVVHHAIHGLDPIRIEISIQQDPLGIRVRDQAEVAHRLG